MKPYPWYNVRNFGTARLFTGLFKKIMNVLRIIAGVLTFGLSELIRIILIARFTRINDAWWKRGLIVLAIGAIAYPITGGAQRWAKAWIDLAYSLGDKATMEPQEAVIGIVLGGFPIGLIITGIIVLTDTYETRIAGEHYIEKSRPTLRTKLRMRRNVEALRTGSTAADGALKMGVIVDDPIPWRTPRYGMICARPIERLGHGAIVGGSDTGKTVLAFNILHQFLACGNGSLYIDFKASAKTYEGVRAAARAANRPFYSFDLGIGSGERSWYDPLAWQGEPSDKASMLASSFNFPETGNAAYYRTIAESWMTLQFQVMERVGRREGESQFDFLRATASQKGLRERLEPLKKGTDADRAFHTEMVAQSSGMNDKDLGNLVGNLNIVIAAGGARLRPREDVPAISLARAAEEGALVYIGLSPSTNEVALKIIGSLALRDLGVLAGTRMRPAATDDELRPMLAIVDEASSMGDRAVVMDTLFKQAREGKVWLWVITQTFSTWPSSTVNEMNANTQTRVVFRIPDSFTSESLEPNLGTIPALSVMSEGRVEHRAFQGDVSSRSGDSRRSITTAPFLVGANQKLMTVKNYHAYVWFTGSHDRATIKEWKPKRPVNQDDIERDAPLVRIVQTDAIANPPQPEEKSVGFLDAAPSVEAMQAWDQQAATVATGSAPAAHVGTAVGGDVPPAGDDPWPEYDDGWASPAPSVWDDQPDYQEFRSAPTSIPSGQDDEWGQPVADTRAVVDDDTEWAPLPDDAWGDPVPSPPPTGTVASDSASAAPAPMPSGAPVENVKAEDTPAKPVPAPVAKTPESGKGEKRKRWE